MSRQNLSNIGTHPPNFTTDSPDGSTCTRGITTFSQKMSNVTSIGCNETNMTSSNNFRKRKLFDPFDSFVYNPWLTILDIVLVLGCVLTIILIYRATKMKDMAGRFLLNQTLSDMCLGVSLLLLTISMYIDSNNSLIRITFLAQKFILSLTQCESMHTLTMLLFTLHVAICSPIYYKLHFRTRYFATFLLVSWTINTICHCAIFVFDLRDVDDVSLTIWLLVDRFSLPAMILYILVCDIIPLLIITVCYIRINIHIKQDNNAPINQSAVKTHVQQAKGVILIGIAELLTLSQTHILDLLMVHLTGAELKDKLNVARVVISVLSYLHVVFKLPILLYGFKSYRRVFISMFTCCVSQPQSSGNVAIVEAGLRTCP